MTLEYFTQFNHDYHEFRIPYDNNDIKDNELYNKIEYDFQNYPLYTLLLLEMDNNSDQIEYLCRKFDIADMIRGVLFTKEPAYLNTDIEKDKNLGYEDKCKKYENEPCHLNTIECFQILLLLITNLSCSYADKLISEFFSSVAMFDHLNNKTINPDSVDIFEAGKLAEAINSLIQIRGDSNTDIQKNYFSLIKRLTVYCKDKSGFLKTIEKNLSNFCIKDVTSSDILDYYNFLTSEDPTCIAATNFIKRLNPSILFNSFKAEELCKLFTSSQSIELFLFYYENRNKNDTSYTHKRLISDVSKNCKNSELSNWLIIHLYFIKLEELIINNKFEEFMGLLFRIKDLPPMPAPGATLWQGSSRFASSIQNIICKLIDSNMDVNSFIKNCGYYNIFLYDFKYLNRLSWSTWYKDLIRWENRKKYDKYLEYLRNISNPKDELFIYMNTFLKHCINFIDVIIDVEKKGADLKNVLQEYPILGEIEDIDYRKKVDDKFIVKGINYIYCKKYYKISFGEHELSDTDEDDSDLIEKGDSITFLISKCRLAKTKYKLHVNDIRIINKTPEKREIFATNVCEQLKRIISEKKYNDEIENQHIYKVRKVQNNKLRLEISMKLLSTFQVLAENDASGLTKLFNFLKYAKGMNLNEFRYFPEQNDLFFIDNLAEKEIKFINETIHLILKSNIPNHLKREIFINSIARKYFELKDVYDILGDYLFNNDDSITELILNLKLVETNNNTYIFTILENINTFYSSYKFVYITENKITETNNSKYKVTLKSFSTDDNVFIVDNILYTKKPPYEQYILKLYDLKKDYLLDKIEENTKSINEIPNFEMKKPQKNKFCAELIMAFFKFNYKPRICYRMLKALKKHNPFKDQNIMPVEFDCVQNGEKYEECLNSFIKSLKKANGDGLFYFIYIYFNSFLSCFINEGSLKELLKKEEIITSESQYDEEYKIFTDALQ